MQADLRPCFFCGFDLKGVPRDAVCPECGKRQHEARDVIDYRAVGLRRTRWLAGFLVIGVVGSFIGLLVFALVFDS